MKILVIGGTVFLGRHIVEYALSKGHELTLFNRGQHNAELFPEVEKIHGDRKTDYKKLSGRKWDAVIDTCGYVLGDVKKTAEILKDSVNRYVFISSINAYRDVEKAGIDENYAEAELPEGSSLEEMAMETYGPLKVLCEKEVEKQFPNGYINIRSGLIVGPYDPSDRFTYWVNRISNGGRVLCPGDGNTPIQFIDVRDLARWSVEMADSGQPGLYNGTGPDYVLTMGNFLQTCKYVCNSEADLIWVNEKFLEDNEVMPWTEMTCWAPESQKEFFGLGKIDISKAVKNNLRFTDIKNTITETNEWDEYRNKDKKLRAGISPDKEKLIIRKYESEA
jgi:2'-hydroxyisoflavone reductase